MNINSISAYPENPYSPPISGVFHEQSPRDTTVPGKYTVYIPDSFQPCSPAVMILAPDYTTAQSFYSGSLGQAWKAEADLRGFTLIIVEADQGQGGAWNLLNATWQRNDDDFLYEIVDTIRQKFSSIPAAFNLDERSLYLVGYEQGGSAAHKMAISWPQLFGGIVSIGGSNVSDELITRNGGKRSFPFIAGQNSDGRETIGLLNQDIPLPAWIVEAANSELNSLTIKNHWINAADAISGSPNIYAQETYSNGATTMEPYRLNL